MSDASPRLRVSGACSRLGTAEVVKRCVAMLNGGCDDTEFILLLGGTPARRFVTDGVPETQAYWLRVWAARGLLWAGPGETTDALRGALSDESWRVREMACKVVARHSLGDLLDDVAELESDAVARVRQAAQRAVVRIVEALA